MTIASQSSIRRSSVTPDGYQVHCSDSATDGLLDAFYPEYDRAFVLDDEKETFAGFVECLNLNSGPAYVSLSQKYGPFRELILLIRDPTDKIVLGGANFICFPLPGTWGYACSTHLNYVFVVPEQRGRGLLRILLGAADAAARELFPASGTDAGRQIGDSQLMFLEQNDPLAMSSDSYALDTAHAGIDQLQRVALWTRAGARIIDFPYVQPALSRSKPAARNLLLSVIGAREPRIKAAILCYHLERFFCLSVLKGRPSEENPEAGRQLAHCRTLEYHHDFVALLDPGYWLRTAAHSGDIARGHSLLEALRSRAEDATKTQPEPDT